MLALIENAGCSIVQRTQQLQFNGEHGNMLMFFATGFSALTDLSPSFIYPVIGVGSLMVVSLFSLLCFQEKLRAKQWIGIAIGAIAVALLSI